VARSDVLDLHVEIGEDSPVEANRVVELFRAMFNKARKWETVPKGTRNPISGFDKDEKFAERSRERWVRPSEMPDLADAIAEEPNPYIRAAIWLLLLTGLRKTEVLRTRWEEIDLARGELRVPETKSGRSHVVPLSDPALEVLRSVPRQSGNPYVICGAHRGEHLKGFAKAWRRIRRRADLEDVTVHDLRRTVGSWLANSGFSVQLIGRVLNHSDPAATEIYARLQEEAPRAALEAHAEELMRVVGSNPALGADDE